MVKFSDSKITIFGEHILLSQLNFSETFKSLIPISVKYRENAAF